MASLLDVQKPIALLDVVVNYLLKSYGVTGHDWQLWAGSAIGAVQYQVYGKALKDHSMVWVSNGWDAISALTTTAMGVLVFGEELSTREWVACGLIVSGLYLLDGKG